MFAFVMLGILGLWLLNSGVLGIRVFGIAKLGARVLFIGGVFSP